MSESFSAEAEAVIAALRVELAQRDRALSERDVVIESLVARVADLQARLGKNSTNSPKPPSSDNPFTKPPPRSLRGKSDRRPGKQPGDPGARLEPRPDPDRVRVHAPVRCGGCAGDLTAAEVTGEQRRQVFDVPPARLEVTEHRVQSRRCGCGQTTTAVFGGRGECAGLLRPGGLGVGYLPAGPAASAVARVAELLADCLGAPVSTGWVAGLLTMAEARLPGFATYTREQAARVAGGALRRDRRPGRGQAVLGPRRLHRHPDPVSPRSLAR